MLFGVFSYVSGPLQRPAAKIVVFSATQKTDIRKNGKFERNTRVQMRVGEKLEPSMSVNSVQRNLKLLLILFVWIPRG